MKWQWLTRAHLLSCLFLELIGSTSMFTISGNRLLIQSRMSRTSTFWLTCTEYRLVPYSPACDLRTLGLTYITRHKVHCTQYLSWTFLFSSTGIIQVSFLYCPFKFCFSILRLRSVCTQSAVFFPAMILYYTEAGRIKQTILCCRKFIVIFGSRDLFIKQLLAPAAECRFLKFSFRAWQKYCILSLLSLGRFFEREYWSLVKSN